MRSSLTILPMFVPRIRTHVIQIRHTAHDKNFRVLAELVADGEELRDLLLKHGLAVPYNGGTKTKDWCAEGP